MRAPLGPSSDGPQHRDVLTRSDLALVAGVVGMGGGGETTGGERLAADPALLERALAAPAVVREVLGPPEEGEAERISRVSPALLFAVAVERVAEEVRGATYVEEWVGPRQRVPVLGGEDLRELLADRGRRVFLTRLLASYTRVSSGSVWRATSRGPRRQRYSDLDPARLAAVLDALPESQHPAVHRRLGDLSLFLTGVFPDHTFARAFRPIDLQRLGRAAAVSGAGPDTLSEALEERGGVGLLETLGARWYRMAAAAGGPGPSRLLEAVAERFGAARRALNLLTDRHLFPQRGTLFPAP